MMAINRNNEGGHNLPLCPRDQHAIQSKSIAKYRHRQTEFVGKITHPGFIEPNYPKWVCLTNIVGF